MRPLLLVTLVTISPASSHEIYAAYSITFYSYRLQASWAVYSVPHWVPRIPIGSCSHCRKYYNFGDLNIHMEKTTDPLQKPIDSVCFVQHVSGPSHCHSHTLDLVLSRGINVVDLNVFPHNPELSDHHFITFAIATNYLLRPQPRTIKSRAINSQTTQRFLDVLPDCLCLPKDKNQLTT